MELPEHFPSCAVGERNAVNDSILVSRYEANTFHLPASTAVNEMSPGSKWLLAPRAMDAIALQGKEMKTNRSILKGKLYLLKNNIGLFLVRKITAGSVTEIVNHKHNNVSRNYRNALFPNACDKRGIDLEPNHMRQIYTQQHSATQSSFIHTAITGN